MCIYIIVRIVQNYINVIKYICSEWLTCVMVRRSWVFLNRSHPFWGPWGSQLFGILVVHHNPIVTRLGVENRRGS